MRIMIINGPNLNLLGVREPHIYGSTTLEAIRAACEEFAAFAGAQLAFHQSNHEGVLVDLIQSARKGADALKEYVKQKIGVWKYPRWIEVVQSLPKTATGKIQRFKLREGAGT